MPTSAEMEATVELLVVAMKKLHYRRMQFHDKVESQGWQLWVTRHAGHQPDAEILGMLSGFPITKTIVKNGCAHHTIPTEDQPLAQTLLDLIKNAAESLERIIAKEPA